MLLILAGLLIWCLTLWRAIQMFGPGRDLNNVSFNSDSAINVLMANDDRPITIFNFYYYGADRWGAWAFLVAQLIRRLTGYHWTPESLTVLQIVWVLVGAFALAGLDRRDRWLAGALYLAVVCLHTESRYMLFELSQLYAWQNTATLLSWWCLRRLFDSFLEPADRAVGRRLAWVLLAFGATYLAIWSSVASAVFLFFLLGVEVLRAWLKGPEGWGVRRVLSPAALGLGALLGAALLERFQKVVYRDYSVRTYGNPYTTTFHFDWAYLRHNFGELWHSLVTLSWWPMYTVPAIGLLAFAGAFVYAVIKRNEDLRTRLTTAIASDTAMLAIGTFVMAVVNFALTVVVDHVRFNDYDTRYLTLTNVFAPISGVLTIFLLVMFVVRQPRAQTVVRAVFVAAVLVLLVIRFPAPREAADYKQLKKTALTLARKAPNGILMGKYWDTYVFTALQPQQPMTPVPFEGDEFRTPWTPAALQRTRDVVVAYPILARQLYSPPATLRQYGRTMTLIDPRWYEDQAYVFALYALM